MCRIRVGKQGDGRCSREGSGGLSTWAFICCCEGFGFATDNTEMKRHDLKLLVGGEADREASRDNGIC